MLAVPLFWLEILYEIIPIRNVWEISYAIFNLWYIFTMASQNSKGQRFKHAQVTAN